MSDEHFVLDLASNPHPRMLAGGIAARRHGGGRHTPYFKGFWDGYLAAMADATGCDPDDLNAWLDRHEADQ